jgi:hydrogenase/urease accessory protein HupE
MISRLAIAEFVAFMTFAAEVSYAHTVGVSRGEYKTSGSTPVQAELVFARPELTAAVPGLDADRDGSVSPEEVDRARGILTEAIASKLELHTPGGPCAGTFRNAFLTEQDGLVIRVVFACQAATETLSIRLNFFGSLSVGHRHIASVTGPDGQIVRAIAHEARPEIQVSRASASAARVAWPLLGLGVEHILTGYDHLVFLFGLILVGGRLRALFVAITAFTLAHSITLGVAALGVWTPSPRFVEPAIALSIAYVGIENWFVRDADRRWLITFPFGLIHGFGFASALGEISLPPAQIPLALAAFNIGVEAGQVAVVAATLPAVLWLGRRRWFADVGVKAASSLIALAGLLWFIGRLA